LFGTTEVFVAKEALEILRAGRIAVMPLRLEEAAAQVLSAFGATSAQIQTPARTHRVAEADLSVGKATPFCSMIQL